MKTGLTLSSALLVALLAAPVAAWADAKPDFDEDAKPILSRQPGLVHYVESRFEVKDTGVAKYPGDDDRPPAPPYIFRARPIGSHGPYNLRLLIQPGQPGHILGVVDITKVHLNQPNGPAVASQAPTQQPPRDQPFTQPEPPPTPSSVEVPELSGGTGQPLQPEQPQPEQPTSPGPVQSTTPSSHQQPTAPTSDTPSGPIMDNTQGAGSTGQSNLAPPPDPVPSGQ